MNKARKQAQEDGSPAANPVESSAHVYFSAGDVPEPLIQELKREIRSKFPGPNSQGILDMDPYAIEVGKNHIEKVRKLLRDLLKAKAPGQYEADGIVSILVTKKTVQPQKPTPTPPVIHERDDSDYNDSVYPSQDAWGRGPRRRR
jgi:hypothetical protein